MKDLEIEKAILGILLSGYRENKLTEECFTTNDNKNLYNAIDKLRDKADLLTVKNELGKSASYLAGFVTDSIGAEKFDDYQNILLSLQSKRLKIAEYEENIRAIEKEEIALDDDSIVPIQSIEYAGDSESYPSGFEWLDKAMKGGFRGGQLILVGGLSGNGKCHGKGTKILMYDGSIKKVEDVIVGDQLMGDDNTPRNVLSLASGSEMLYTVKSKHNKTEPYIINESHILSLYNGHNGWGKKGVKDIPLKEYINKGDSFKKYHYGYKVPVEFDEKETSIDPYFMGLWLGDGHTADSRVTTMDSEIVDYLYNYANKLGLQVTKTFIENNNANTYAITRGCLKGGNQGFSLRKLLRLDGVLNNKHIPEIYKINSRQNRLKLLAGLIDSDGSYNSNGYDYVTKLEILADDIVFLCRSLGLQAKKKVKYNKKYDKNYYRVCIHGELSEVPVLLQRKKCHKRKQMKNVLHYGIEVEKNGIGDYYGFQLDGNHRYLLGDFTVTHNTTWSLQLTYNFSRLGIPTVWFSYEMRINELQEKLKEMGNYEDLLLYLPKVLTSYTVEWLENKVVEAIEKTGSKMIFIDNLDFLDTSKQSFSAIDKQKKLTTALKRIANEHNVTILLNVHVHKLEEGKEPRMQNIYGASEIFKLSDTVIFVHRIPEEVGRGEQALEMSDFSKIIVCKNRKNGKGIGYFRMKFEDGLFKEITAENKYVENKLSQVNSGKIDRNSRVL